MNRHKRGFQIGLFSLSGNNLVTAQVQNGFLTALNKEVRFEFRHLNANEDLDRLEMLGKELVVEQFDLVYTIGKTATVVVRKYTQKMIHPTPVMFSSVADPFKAGLIKTPRFSGNNLTGFEVYPVSGEEQVCLLLDIKPTIKKVVLVYHPLFTLQSRFEKSKRLLEMHGVTVVPIEIRKKEDIRTSLIPYLQGCDAVILLRYASIAGFANSLVDVCNYHKVLLYTADWEAVKEGSPIGFGASEYEVGVAVAKKSLDILYGKQYPNSLPIELFEWKPRLMINAETVLVRGFDIDIERCVRRHNAVVIKRPLVVDKRFSLNNA
jgi:ABC-type uncharacterized transport system substrate-binding protein